MSEVTVNELEIKIALMEDLIKSGKGRINEVCVGCGKARSGVGLSSDGYHYDCKPCKGCLKAREGVGLVDGEYHYECN